MSKVSRHVVLGGVFGLLVASLSLAAAAWAVRARFRKMDLDSARHALAEGRYALARERLARLAGASDDDGEASLLLGECELARGQRDGALAAWAKVPQTSPYFCRAALLRATHLVNSGRYTPAEQILLQALETPGDQVRFELERALARLYRFEGRFDDVRRLARGSWLHSTDAADGLKELWALDHSPMPVESWGLALEKADDDDDRVWLGRARNAILTGQLAIAAAWLDRCRQRRPGDAAVWRAVLELAMAREDVPTFSDALEHVPAAGFEPQSVHELRAWLAAQRGEKAREEQELRAQLAVAPGDTKALARLAFLCFQSGRARETEVIHRRKGAVDRAQDTIRKTVLDAAGLFDAAGRLRELSRELGRAFDTEAWDILDRAREMHPAGSAGLRGVAPVHFSPDLAARARSLCAPYRRTASVEIEGARLAQLFADLRTTPLPPKAASPSPAGSAPVPSPEFVDDSETAGLRFVFDNGRTPQHFLPETMSGGIGLLDFNGDGWMDVYCVQGGSILGTPAGPPGATVSDGDRLFVNRGDGTFQDASVASGIARIAWGHGYGLGVAVGDFDNDGHPDLFVSRLRSYALYRNRGDGSFEDATRRAGLEGTRDNPTSAAFADLDNDGDLDLYVCHYMIWDPEHPRLCRNEKGEYFYCDPSKVEPAPDHVFRNDGGRFVDVTRESGLAESRGRGLGVVAADIDGDNRIDLYVANDGTANYLYHNEGGFRFKEIALEAGVAGSAEGGFQAGMGVACGDWDGDGRQDLLVTNFYGEGTTLYQNLGETLFADRSAASGIGSATRYLLGFGIALIDVTNCGRLDLVIANGHVNDNRPYYPYAMPCRLYQNQPGGRFVDVSQHAGEPWSRPFVGRGLAAGDLDNDGRRDVLVLGQNEPVAYLRNRTRASGQFLILGLEGTASNRDGVGASVIVTSGGTRQVLQRTGGGSYQSAHDPRLHVGLGRRTSAETVEVRWPSGKIDRFSNLAAGTGYLLREGAAHAEPLAGFPGGPRR
jgi:thioredoxin-like negative regulator of GroEL